MNNNTPTIHTERLILRRFTENDVVAFRDLMNDPAVNTFIPVFPFETLTAAQDYLREYYLKTYDAPLGFRYAICLKENDTPIGYVNVSPDDSHDFGYALQQSWWHKGIVTEAAKAVVEAIRKSGIPYLTATHDVSNPRSGNVMKNLGMKYCYSYEEQWQPKNKLVIFRMYQLNLDENSDFVYQQYWLKYPHHFVEENV
ncbi:GNAT family N-acetyltransferase [Chitinophaga sp. Cy-1792]|uniref:GNAT family N-acetyltransferase n=1 Tax=Chitinophaga sp. Cy-1792 TaxID=2608339 RepID=UPI0014226BCC|nr:GNAT family N-acetyltransferase [Chitinophaga sp. Cy-1792]NIG54382.1 GNAT family N-acetyltransferase [Chitinophaga sp. Cy-1792]